LIQKADPSRGHSAVGADIGATLTKLAIRGNDGRTQFRLVSSRDIGTIAREVESLRPERVGLTGGGAAALDRLLGLDTARTDEFAAWRRGAIEMLHQQNVETSEPFLLVSLGTGTSALRVHGEEVERAGGTALGGGTIVGLCSALTGTANFREICGLAERGDRHNVDLLVSDIDPSGDLPLPGNLNAASFAKLAREVPAEGPNDRPNPADLARAVMGMVAENVGLICSALAAAAEVNRLVFGGSTLRDNAALCDVLRGVCVVRGQEAVLLENPEFAGALGALGLVLGTGIPAPLAGSRDPGSPV
jgi:type II pantothenate kinase